jgi:poly(3-hydroxybutyrate) depolymerase
MRKFFGSMGSVSRVTVQSEALKSNMLGDPSVRVVDVYVPAGHDGQGLPLLVDLVGFTGSGLSHTNWVGFGENLPERLDRLIGEQRMPPVVVAFPDCFTRLGGNQYINSASMGAWEDFLLHEMLPAIEERFGCGGTGRRGVFGKSSGGYGAMTHALRHSDVWSAAACHSGDMGFELCYLPDMPAVLRALAGVENSIEKWWQKLEPAQKHPEGSGKVVNRAGDGGQLRSRSHAIPWDPAAGHVRYLRSSRGALGELVVARPCRRDRNPGGQSPQAEGALHRLR